MYMYTCWQLSVHWPVLIKRLASVQVIMSEVKVGWLPKVQMFRTQELSFLWIKGLRYRNL